MGVSAECWKTQPIHPHIVLPCLWERLKAKTTHLTTTERGGYWWLLLHQWQFGYLPAQMKQLALIMGCSVASAKSIWVEVGSYFTDTCPCGCGCRRNRSMEEKRAEQQKRSKIGSYNAAKTHTKRLQTASETGSQSAAATTAKRVLPDPDPSLSVPLNQSTTTSTPSVAEVGGSSAPSDAQIMSPLRFAKLQQSHVFIGSRLRVPHVLHDELRTKLGGEQPTVRLLTWYGDLNAEVEQSGEPILDVFVWLRPRFLQWAGDVVGEAEKAKFLREVSGGR